MKTTYPLMPCPFCGKKDGYLENDNDEPYITTHWWIQCPNCGAQGPYAKSPNYKHTDEAIEKAKQLWATRIKFADK